MRKEPTLAENILKEIQDTQNKLKSLEPKIKWITDVKKDPNKAANIYFEIFDHFVAFPGGSDQDWEKFSLLLHFGAKPLSVKNKDGLNPFEYFYKINREKRLSLHNLSEAYDFARNQNEMRLVRVANRLYNTFREDGVDEQQLLPLQKSRDLWYNYQRLTRKQCDTGRVAFARLLKTVIAHPENAVDVDEFKRQVNIRLKQEEKEEIQAWKEWEGWAERDYRARFSRPNPGHARGYSSFVIRGYGEFTDAYFLNQPLPDSAQKALDDFLLSLKDEDEMRTKGLALGHVLPEKRIKAYKRALNPPKHFERTR